MTNGILGIIACPMLEDELLYGLINDHETKIIYVLDNESANSIRKKLEKKNIPYNLISHDDFYSGNTEIYPNGYRIIIDMNKLGLHAEPKELKSTVEEQITAIQPLVDAIGVYYGICGNYGWDVTKWSKQMGYKPAAVFRDKSDHICDDCIGVCVGGGERYLELEQKHTGKFYVTPCIANNWQDFIFSSDEAKSIRNLTPDMMEILGLHGVKDYSRWLFSLGGYKYILQLDTGLEDDRAEFNEQVKIISKEVNLKIQQAEPSWPTLEPTQDMYKRCKKQLSETI